jgi:hypothetical protein
MVAYTFHRRQSALFVRRRMWIRNFVLACTCFTSVVTSRVYRLLWDLPSALAMIFRCSLHSRLFRQLESPNHQYQHHRIRNSPRGPTRARSLFPPRIREYNSLCTGSLSVEAVVQATVTTIHICTHATVNYHRHVFNDKLEKI